MTPARDLSGVADAAFPEQWYDITADGHFWLEWRFEAFLHQLEDLGISRSTRWHGLDVGCGHGAVRRQIERASTWVTDGTDLNREALSRNRDLKGETLRYDVLERRPELAARYDFIVLFDVIEHIVDPHLFVDAVVHHLRPGGWLFVNVPAIDGLKSSYDRAIGHLRRYERSTLRAALVPHHLEIRDVRYWGFSMLPYLLLRKLMSIRNDPVADVIRRGVSLPRPWMNRWILRIMALETECLRRPAIGTSLLAAAVKAE